MVSDRPEAADDCHVGGPPRTPVVVTRFQIGPTGKVPWLNCQITPPTKYSTSITDGSLVIVVLIIGFPAALSDHVLPKASVMIPCSRVQYSAGAAASHVLEAEVLYSN